MKYLIYYFYLQDVFSVSSLICSGLFPYEYLYFRYFLRFFLRIILLLGNSPSLSVMDCYWVAENSDMEKQFIVAGNISKVNNQTNTGYEVKCYQYVKISFEICKEMLIYWFIKVVKELLIGFMWIFCFSENKSCS